MTQRQISPLLVALVGLVVLALVGRAFGAGVACDQRIESEAAKYAQGRGKALQSCEDRKARGSLPPSTVCATDPAAAAKIARAGMRLRGSIASACGGADKVCGNGDDTPLATAGWGGGAQCPNLGGTSCTRTIASCADIAECVACLADAAVKTTVDISYGSLEQSEFGTGSETNRCQRAVGKETGKYFGARAKALGKCWSARLAGTHANACPSPGDGRAARTIARAEARKVAKICRACGGADRACNGAGDATPAQVGFAASCPAVQVPGGGACGGTVSDLGDIVACVDCVAMYTADCATIAAAPRVVAYPAACGVVATTTTSTSTSTTTSTTTPLTGTFLDFTTGLPGGICGATYSDVSGTTKIKNLTCGGLSLGGGSATVPEGPTPDGATNRFVADCTGNTCTLEAVTGAGSDYDCTATGCNFGVPLPIVNGGISTCVQNVFATPASGSLDLTSGAATLTVALDSIAVLTGQAAQPCPICRVGTTAGAPCAGTVDSPCAGVCEGSGNQSSPCTSTNSQGLSRDCPQPQATEGQNRCYRGTNSGAVCTTGGQCPGGTCSQQVGIIPVDLTPLGTGTAELQSATGNFCPSQAQPGCFTNPNSGACRLIRETGSPAGPITMDVPADVILASTFCIGAASSSLINGAASLPGPGATTLKGEFLLHEVVAASTTTTIAPASTTSTTVGPTTTSTSTTSTSTSTTTSTSTIPAPGTRVLDLTTTTGAGSCGASRNGSNAVIQSLSCGALNLGGGGSTVPEGPIPDGATNRFLVTGCAGDDCTLGASTGAPNVDCTGTSCPFGPPLPISNAGLSTCIVNSFASPSGGTLNLATGAMSIAIPLSAHVYVTGNGTQPCPRCSASGSPSNPATGNCDRGARAGQLCTTRNSQGLSVDCQPGGSDGSTDLGSISVDLSPVVTGMASDSDPAGLFCPGQVTANNNQGCFGSTSCRSFSETGMLAGALVLDTPSPVALASAFCIPATGNILIDGAASLPGPGAASLAGTVTLREFTGTSTTTTTPPSTTSTSTTPGSSTTTTTSTSTSTTTLLPLPPLTVEFTSGLATGTDCGTVRDGSGTIITPLACGDLALGGGASTIPPSSLPDGAVNRFTLQTADLGCILSALTACPLGPTLTAGPGFDCTTTGCHFGPPVPVPNGALSACSVSTFSAPTTGTVNLLTGATTANVALGLHLYLTGNGAQACPRCSATGSPGTPGSGTCDRGARMGLACTTMNSQGLSNDCLPGGTDGSVDLGTINANLSPVTSGTASASNPSGLFCPSQTTAGCFGDPTCRSFTETGAAPNAALASAEPQPATLVSTFCVPASGNLLVDGSADLPGPAAISLPGTIRAQL